LEQGSGIGVQVSGMLCPAGTHSSSQVHHGTQAQAKHPSLFRVSRPTKAYILAGGQGTCCSKCRLLVQRHGGDSMRSYLHINAHRRLTKRPQDPKSVRCTSSRFRPALYTQKPSNTRCYVGSWATTCCPRSLPFHRASSYRCLPMQRPCRTARQ
jgi:hypothetical protein